MRQGPLQVCELLVVCPHELLLAVLHVGLVQLPQAVQLLPQQRLVLALQHGDDDNNDDDNDDHLHAGVHGGHVDTAAGLLVVQLCLQHRDPGQINELVNLLKKENDFE